MACGCCGGSNGISVIVANAGPQGAGVPPGGTTGQYLAKASNANYDDVWVDPGSVLPAGRTVIASGTVTILDSDGIVNINKTVGSATAVIVASGRTPWKVFTLKDAKGDAFTNHITVTPASGLIDNQASVSIQNNLDSLDIYADETGNLFTK